MVGLGRDKEFHATHYLLHCQQHPILHRSNREIERLFVALSIDDIMAARVTRSLMCSSSTPLFMFQPRHGLANFTTSKHQLIISIMQPKITEGQDESKVISEAEALLDNGWTLDDEEMGVKKQYHFKTYTKVLVRGLSQTFTILADTLQDFVHVIGVRSKSKNHHSVIIIVRFTLFPQCLKPDLHSLQQTGSVDVHWTTHHPRGLSDKDTFMARYCDEQARLVGTVDESEAQKCGPPSSSQM